MSDEVRIMTFELGYDLCAKPVQDEGETLWIIFRSGNLQQPLMILHEHSILRLWTVYNETKCTHSNQPKDSICGICGKAT